MHLRLTKRLHLCLQEANGTSVAWAMTSSSLCELVRKFEENGLAMRYLDRKARIGWKCSPKLLMMVRDARKEVEDDWEDV